MNQKRLPPQPHFFISYLRVGRLLYYSLVLFILESLVYWFFLKKSYLSGGWNIITVFWFCCFLFSFVHIFLVMADGWSRYQNYKRAKDQFFEHGFKTRIASLYLESKCQRNACIEAARELGLHNEVISFYHSRGVRWYHYIPYFMLKDPFFIIRKKFWDRTFLEKNYTSKYDYRKIQIDLAL
ncbi:hypothetical protein [Robertkochia aurantiaca]|uniref:hypothetical protein n=1 Tax=Robertkochia aurantiaca TaxID=2873700 RepID=UPI001CCE4804|nr:hypothetical protein [Robertkochia sp. 3YJGBD-33]